MLHCRVRGPTICSRDGSTTFGCWFETCLQGNIIVYEVTSLVPHWALRDKHSFHAGKGGALGTLMCHCVW